MINDVGKWWCLVHCKSISRSGLLFPPAEVFRIALISYVVIIRVCESDKYHEHGHGKGGQGGLVPHPDCEIVSKKSFFNFEG